MQVEPLVEVGKLLYKDVIQPGILVWIALELRYLKTSMRRHIAERPTNSDVDLKIAKHKEDCRLIEAITPVHGKGNGHARIMVEES